MKTDLNWTEKSNADLAVGDNIVTKFHKRTRKGLRGTMVKEVIHNPRGCRGHVHVKTSNGQGGCYDHIAHTAVFR